MRDSCLPLGQPALWRYKTRATQFAVIIRFVMDRFNQAHDELSALALKVLFTGSVEH